MKKNRKHNYQRIKGNFSYNFTEISEQLKVHIRTVQLWRKKGMKVIDENSRPYIVLGTELKKFLKEKRLSHRVSLKPTEFYCPKCGVARESMLDRIVLDFTQKILGKNQKQVIIKGICTVCNSKMNRFSTEEKIKIIITNGMLSTKRDIILPDNIHSYSNADIRR